METPTLPSPTLKPWQEGIAAARQNLIPGLVLQALALAVVLFYYLNPSFARWFEQVGDLKARVGIPFAIVSTALFGGVIPFVYMRLHPATRETSTWSTFAFMTLFWAYRGFEIDMLYRFQAFMFGNDLRVATIVLKVAFDQFIFNVIWAGPLQILAYQWKDRGYRASFLSGYSWSTFFLRKIPAILISIWAVWIPMCAIIYALPAPLQLPLFNLVLCFWSLLLATLTRRKEAPSH